MTSPSENKLTLAGEVSSSVEYSHESHESKFFTFKIKSRRLSGTYDEINVLARESLIPEGGLFMGDFISISGEVRSFNKKSETESHLIISAFALEITPLPYEHYENSLTLCGTICKAPVLRRTPLGREICDIMLAVNRRYGRSDYLPLVSWGKNAEISGELSVGDIITVTGRLQSREYVKTTCNGEEKRVAFEVSVSSVEL